MRTLRYYAGIGPCECEASEKWRDFSCGWPLRSEARPDLHAPPGRKRVRWKSRQAELVGLVDRSRFASGTVRVAWWRRRNCFSFPLHYVPSGCAGLVEWCRQRSPLGAVRMLAGFVGALIEPCPGSLTGGSAFRPLLRNSSGLPPLPYHWSAGPLVPIVALSWALKATEHVWQARVFRSLFAMSGAWRSSADDLDAQRK